MSVAPRRIAIVGGISFETDALDRFLLALKEKYPNAVIVTGKQRGAEKHAAESAELLGFRVEVPPLHPEWFGAAATDCQINDILIGADAIVVAGSPTGGRAKIAIDWWHRMNMHARDPRGKLLKDKSGNYVSKREPWNRTVLHQIAAPPSTGKKRGSAKAKNPVGA